MTDAERDSEDEADRGAPDRDPARLEAASERADPASLEGMCAHEAGQGIGFSPVLRQMSVLLGSFPRRGWKRVNLPI